MKFRIVTKISVLAMVLVLVTAGTVGIVLYTGGNAVLVKHELESLGEELHLQGGRIISTVEALRHDVLFLGRTPPIRGIVRARMAGGSDPLDGSTEVLWRQRLEIIFTQFLEAKPDYFQLRYIGLTDGARELVRVERLGKAIVVGETLQVESTGSYIQKAARLEPDEVYLSDITLARKDGRVAESHIPTLQAAAPVYSTEGEVIGVVVIAMDFSLMLKKSSYKRHAYYYVTNAAGDFLAHQDVGVAFGFDLGERHRIQETYPELAEMFESGGREKEMAHFVSSDYSEGVCFLKVAFDPLHPERFFGLAQAAPYLEVVAESIQVRDRSLMLTVLLVAGGIVLAFFLSRFLIRPLEQIARAAEGFTGGKFEGSLPVKSHDEIGVLARAFQDMIQQVAERDRVLQESEERFRKIFDHSNDAIFLIDPSRDEILDVNTRACSMLGYTQEELLSLSISVIHPNEMPKLLAFSESVFEQGQGWTDELTCRTRSDLVLPSEMSASVIDLGGRSCLIVLVRDITERKQAQEAQRETERVRVLIETAGAAAHEINQPLTVAMGLGQLMLNDTALDDSQRDKIESIVQMGKRISEIVSKMRDIQQYVTKPYFGKANIVDFDAAIQKNKQGE